MDTSTTSTWDKWFKRIMKWHFISLIGFVVITLAFLFCTIVLEIEEAVFYLNVFTTFFNVLNMMATIYYYINHLKQISKLENCRQSLIETYEKNRELYDDLGMKLPSSIYNQAPSNYKKDRITSAFLFVASLVLNAGVICNIWL